MALTERYTIDQKLGEGGFGAVFRGIHRQMSTPVAIKVLHAQHASSSETVARFEQEARRSAALKHPNTIRVFDFGKDDDGSLFIVMELLEGAPLSHHIKHGRLAADRVVHIVSQALAALDEAHQQGLVHRDLKPDNLFLTKLGKDPDFVKVLDFGIAKALDANAKLTASGVVIGTPTYMSPEQCRGAALDPRSDLYSLGCIAYEMLAGRPPFLADTVVGYIFAHVQQAPDLTKLAPNVPEPLIAWVGRCLEKDPAARFGSADEARDALLTTTPHSSTPSIGASRPPTSPSLPNHPTHTPVALDIARSDAPLHRQGKRLAIGGGVVAVGLLVWGIVAITSATSSTEGPTAEGATPRFPLPITIKSSWGAPEDDVLLARSQLQATTLGDTTQSASEPADIVQPTAPDITPDTTPPEVSAPAPQRVALSSVPTGATVKRDGQVLGQTPLELTWFVGETTPFKVELRNHDTVALRPTELTGKAVHEVRLARTNTVAGDGDTHVAGDLDATAVQQHVRSQLSGIKQCYGERLGVNRALAGKATLAFTILPNGSVLDPRLVNSSLLDVPLETCIVGKMSRWKFPQPKDGGVVEVAYPLILKTQ